MNILESIDQALSFVGVFTFSGMKRKYSSQINGRCIATIPIDCHWPGIGEYKIDSEFVIFSAQYNYLIGKHKTFLGRIHAPDSCYFDYIRLIVKLKDFRYLLDGHYTHTLLESEDYFVSGYNDDGQIEVKQKGGFKHTFYLDIRPEYKYAFNRVNKEREFVVYQGSYYKFLR